MTDARSDVRETLNPVMLEFGATVYICQLFENSLCLLLALMSEQRLPSAGQAFQASWDFHSEKTLGGLIAALKERIELPSDFESFLREGVDHRNAIVHGYMTKNTPRFMDPKGRLEVIDELRGIRNNVRKRDLAVCKLLDALLAKYGTSTETLKRNADVLWDALNLPIDPISH